MLEPRFEILNWFLFLLVKKTSCFYGGRIWCMVFVSNVVEMLPCTSHVLKFELWWIN
jgi:hypothetical protein